MQVALGGLEGIYRPGYRYQKAGLMLMNLASPGHIQVDLCGPAPRPCSQELMAAPDRMNASMWRGCRRRRLGNEAGTAFAGLHQPLGGVASDAWVVTARGVTPAGSLSASVFLSVEWRVY